MLRKPGVSVANIHFYRYFRPLGPVRGSPPDAKRKSDMKKMMILAAAAVTAISCGGGKGKNATDAPVSAADTAGVRSAVEWKALDPYALEFNPFETVGKDWMALATGAKGKTNSMTISWGTAGVLWSKPVFIVYVSSDRYTKHLMDSNAYFTVMSFPREKKYKDALLYIGTHSGKDEPDKAATAGFATEYTALGNPLFSEADMVFECKTIYREEFKKDKLPADVQAMYEDMGIHTMYIGEVINVFGKETEEGQ